MDRRHVAGINLGASSVTVIQILKLDREECWALFCECSNSFELSMTQFSRLTSTLSQNESKDFISEVIPGGTIKRSSEMIIFHVRSVNRADF
jgi:hypothetical protein